MAGSSPNITHGVQKDYKILYQSEPLAALKVPITIQSGYGILAMGTAIARNLSAAGGVGKCVPYNPTTFIGDVDQAGRAFLVQNSGTGAKIVYVTQEDSYRFAIGDDLIVNSNGEDAENLGAITAIDRTTERQRVAITATENLASDHTTANSGYVCVEAGDNTNNYSDCIGILEKDVDTGVDENAAGAEASIIISNASLYSGMLTNVDAAAIADIVAVSVSRFLIIK